MTRIQRLFSILAISLIATMAYSQEPPSGEDLSSMMAKAQQYTQPGEHHSKLERLVGNWKTQMRITMQGAPDTATEGTASIKWIMPGRWLQMESNGSLMGLPMHSITLLGYDNFKQSYVTTAISTIDTAMNHAEGDFTPDDKALILYGTLDEYLTGEHDKMVKTVYRFVSDNEITIEVHDLPIGEVNTQVLEFKLLRDTSVDG